jgi:cell division transport system permease protein
MRFRTVAAEAWRSLAANASTTLAATLTVIIAMFVLGLSIGLGTYMWSWSKIVKHELVVKVYFCTPSAPERSCNGRQATAKEIDNVGNLLSKIPEVQKMQFISREEALSIMKRRRPELVTGLATNPLPASFKVIPNRGEDIFTIANRINSAKLPGVEKAETGRQKARRVLRVATVIEIVFAIAIAILSIASILLISNTIRLSIFSRRREIEVMKLVGATNWFVRGPFMLEGVICGVAGALFAVILLILGKEIALPAILGHVNNSGDAHAWPFSLTALILIGFGVVVGAAGSGATIRRFLRV